MPPVDIPAPSSVAPGGFSTSLRTSEACGSFFNCSRLYAKVATSAFATRSGIWPSISPFFIKYLPRHRDALYHSQKEMSTDCASQHHITSHGEAEHHPEWT